MTVLWFIGHQEDTCEPYKQMFRTSSWSRFFIQRTFQQQQWGTKPPPTSGRAAQRCTEIWLLVVGAWEQSPEKDRCMWLHCLPGDTLLIGQGCQSTSQQ